MLIASAPKTTTEMIVFHGKDIDRVNSVARMFPKGGVIKFRSFLSTTLDFQIAVDFFQGVTCCLFIIRVPEGMPCAFMQPLTEYSSEFELLFPQGTILQVDDPCDTPTNNGLCSFKLQKQNGPYADIVYATMVDAGVGPGVYYEHLPPPEENSSQSALDDDDDSGAEFEIEEILGHDDSPLQFLVKWVGYDDPTWEPYDNVKDAVALEKYLQANNVPGLQNSDDEQVEDGVAGSQDSDDEEYGVEAILNHRTTADGPEFSVKWAGYPDPTWEPYDNIKDVTALEDYLQTNNVTGLQDSDDEEHGVEVILDHRTTEDGLEFLVKWVGYPEPSWEPYDHVKDVVALDRYVQTNNVPGLPDRDEKEFEIEAILNHKATARQLKFLVKWVGYPQPTWEPYEYVQYNTALEDYVQKNKVLGFYDREQVEYSTEAILDHRTTANGPEFKVKWVGYEETTWEPYKKMKDDAALSAYLQTNAVPGIGDSDNDEQFQVEAILAHNITPNQALFKVKWVGYEETTWEPYDNLKNVVALDTYLRDQLCIKKKNLFK
jgi:hypothetical protein